MINVITLFSGYDSQCLALNRLGVDYNLVAWSEIDKYAIQAHNALFPQYADRNLGDITKIDWSVVTEQIDLLTYSSPCQDFSSAGLQRGGEKGSGTRSGLLWECERAIEQLRPKYLVFENVAALVSEKFMPTFLKWGETLRGLGYENYWQLMNAKNYSVPQNRLRVFMVSVRNGEEPRHYVFPQPFKLEKRLKDVLEQNVDERCYLKEEQVQKLVIHETYKNAELQDNVMLDWTRSNTGKGDPTYHPVSVANCVTAAKRDNTQNYILEPTIAAMRGRDKDNPNDRGKSTDNYAQRLELKTDGTSNTLTSVAKDNLLVEPAILTPVRTEYGKAVRKQYGDNNLPESRHNLTALQPKQDGTISPTIMASQNELLRYEGISPTINTCQGGQREPKIIEDFYGTVRDPRVYTEEAPTLRADRTGLMATEGIRIRRLTERELYRLMDVEEKDIDTLLNAGIPKTQHAKLAGNSIVVSCLYHIFDRLLVHTEKQDKEQLTIFDMGA